MENPIKENLKVNVILKMVVGLIIVFAILDLLNLTNYIIYPYTSIKSKFFPGTGSTTGG